jgi:hypothetical protein
MKTMPLDKPGPNTMAATKPALTSALSVFTGVNPWFLSASTRLNIDHQNLPAFQRSSKHFKANVPA